MRYVQCVVSGVKAHNLLCTGIERKILKNAIDLLLDEGSIILYLLHRKANVNSRDNFGCTPLHYAASKCNETAVMQLLTDKNIDLEVSWFISHIIS